MLVVPGLSRFTIRGGGFCEAEGQLASHDTKYDRVLLDGNWLAWSLYESRRNKRQAEDSEENMEGYREKAKEFFSRFSQSAARLVIQSQSDAPGEEVAKLKQSLLQAPLIPPAPAKVIIQLARATRAYYPIYRDWRYAEVYECTESFYDFVRYLSRKNDCPIVSNDGLFYARTPTSGFIPYESLTSFSCKILELDGGSESCLELEHDKLALINALVRVRSKHDTVGTEISARLRNRLAFIVSPVERKRILLAAIWPHLHYKAERKSNALGRWNEQTLFSIWTHLHNKTHEEAKESLVNLAGQADRESVCRIIDEAPMDLKSDRTARELRDDIEDLCACPDHHRTRVANWLEFLHEQAELSRAKCIIITEQMGTAFESADDPTVDDSQPPDRRPTLLKCFETSGEKFDELLGSYCSDLNDKLVQEFLTVKLLLSANDADDPEMNFTKDFKQATLSSLLFYLADDSEFLADYRAKLAYKIDHYGHKLRTPLKDISLCNSSSVEQLRLLIGIIGKFNELNALSGYSMEPVKPDKWLNPCLIYNLTETPRILGYQIPAQLSCEYG